MHDTIIEPSGLENNNTTPIKVFYRCVPNQKFATISHREKPVVHNGVTLHFKGFLILQAILDSLMTKGLSKADEVILTGCSAGGLATYLHADYVASVIPQSAKYHAIPDAG